jgi:hypothetical protein
MAIPLANLVDEALRGNAYFEYFAPLGYEPGRSEPVHILCPVSALLDAG